MSREKKPVATLTADDGIKMKMLLTGQVPLTADESDDRPDIEREQHVRIEDDGDVFEKAKQWHGVDNLEDGVRHRRMMLEADADAEHAGGGSILAAHWGN